MPAAAAADPAGVFSGTHLTLNTCSYDTPEASTPNAGVVQDQLQ